MDIQLLRRCLMLWCCKTWYVSELSTELSKTSLYFLTGTTVILEDRRSTLFISLGTFSSPSLLISNKQMYVRHLIVVVIYIQRYLEVKVAKRTLEFLSIKFYVYTHYLFTFNFLIINHFPNSGKYCWYR